MKKLPLSHRVMGGSVLRLGAASLIAGLAIPATSWAAQCVHPQGGVEIPLLGDVNGSGTVNVTDALCVVLAVLANQAGQPLSGVACLTAGWRAGDVSCDGALNIIDAQACVHLGMGLALPAGLAPGEDGCPAACTPCVAPGGTSCLIGGSCVPAGERTGADECMVCDPAVDDTAWTEETCAAWYLDSDSDGYGVDGNSVCRCAPLGSYAALTPGDCDDGDDTVYPGASELCDGVDNNCDNVVDEGCTSAGSCQAILEADPLASSGVYSIDPDGAGGAEPVSVYCDMVTDGGGWTKIMSAQWSHFFNSSTWQDLNASSPTSANYSRLASRAAFYDPSTGCATWRITVGNSGDWLSGPRAHYTVWQQCHDPFTASTAGGDYTFIAGEASTTCGGFNGLHHAYQGFSYASDADINDSVNCWWMQIAPHTNYNSQGYLEGYGGTHQYHQWQALWIREALPNGSTSSNPGTSCDSILDAAPSATSGIYWIDPGGPGGAAPFQVYCDMTTAGGGWTLISNRRAGTANTEACGSNIAGFFGSGCGAVTAVDASNSYALPASSRNSIPKTEMLVIQYLDGVPDTDDAYIVTLGGLADPFPNSVGSWITTPVSGARSLDGSVVDTTSVYWVYTGTSWYHSSVCNGGYANDTQYRGNYGLCHNGLGSYDSSSFVGNRKQYEETKLWSLASIAAGYQERIFYR